MRLVLNKTKFFYICEQAGIKRKLALSLLKLLIDQENKHKIKKVRKPKLSAVTNPNSKYYDNTPNLTKHLSLLFYTHQLARKRLRHKRITSSDRQWVLLVQIKQYIVNVTGDQLKDFSPVAKRVLMEAEKIANIRGRDNIYLTHVLSGIEELLDLSVDRLEAVITTKENKMYRAYRRRRKELTGKKLDDLEPGGRDHTFIRRIVEIGKEYRVSAKVFMNIQFGAFIAMDSFPRLKDLITMNAIDRLEQGLLKLKPKRKYMNKEDKAYWDAIENKING